MTTYPYLPKLSPTVGNGLPGLPRRKAAANAEKVLFKPPFFAEQIDGDELVIDAGEFFIVSGRLSSNGYSEKIPVSRMDKKTLKTDWSVYIKYTAVANLRGARLSPNKKYLGVIGSLNNSSGNSLRAWVAILDTETGEVVGSKKFYITVSTENNETIDIVVLDSGEFLMAAYWQSANNSHLFFVSDPSTMTFDYSKDYGTDDPITSLGHDGDAFYVLAGTGITKLTSTVTIDAGILPAVPNLQDHSMCVLSPNTIFYLGAGYVSDSSEHRLFLYNTDSAFSVGSMVSVGVSGGNLRTTIQLLADDRYIAIAARDYDSPQHYFLFILDHAFNLLTALESTVLFDIQDLRDGILTFFGGNISHVPIKNLTADLLNSYAPTVTVPTATVTPHAYTHAASSPSVTNVSSTDDGIPGVTWAGMKGTQL